MTLDFKGLLSPKTVCVSLCVCLCVCAVHAVTVEIEIVIFSVEVHLQKFYAVSQKKVPTSELSVTLLILNRYSKFLQCWNAYEIYYKTHTTLPTSPWACCYTTLGN